MGLNCVFAWLVFGVLLVLTEGKIFTKNDLPSSVTKKNIITYLGGPEHWGFEWAFSGDESIRHEGYAFLWNKDRLDLSTAEVIRNGQKFTRVYTPRMINVNRRDMHRKPYFARFTPHGKAGGSNFEIRLLCIHNFLGDDSKSGRGNRLSELDVLLTDIYPQVADMNFQNGFPRYTVMLGDYNAELKVEKRDAYRKSKGMKIPVTMEECVHSDKYGVDIITTQDQLTTLKTKKQDSLEETILERGYASNYDHFSYDEKAIGHVVKKRPQRIDAVREYYNDDFEEYFRRISDHIPIIMELQIN